MDLLIIFTIFKSIHSLLLTLSPRAIFRYLGGRLCLDVEGYQNELRASKFLNCGCPPGDQILKLKLTPDNRCFHSLQLMSTEYEIKARPV